MNYDTRIAAEDLVDTDSAAVLLGDTEEDRQSRRKLWAIGLAVLAALIGIWFLTHRGDQGGAGDKKSQAAVVSVVAPGRGTIEGAINVTGTLAARRELGAIWRERMGTHYPAMSMIFVADLLDNPGKIELEATAVVGGR